MPHSITPPPPARTVDTRHDGCTWMDPCCRPSVLQFHMCCVLRCCSAYLGCTNFPFKHISRMLLQCSVFNFLSSSCSIQTKGSVWFCSLFAKEKHKVQLVPMQKWANLCIFLKNLNLSVNSRLRIHFSHIHTQLNSIIDGSHKLFYLYWL